MKTRFLIPLLLSTGLLAVLFLFLSFPASADVDAGWQTVANGIEYQEFHFPGSDDLGPNDVYVARMDRSNPNVTIDSTIAQGRLSGGLETVSGMFNRYEDTINYWGQSWGKRNDVVVAINGYFYGPEHEPPGVPWRGQIHSGWYAKRHDDNENGSGFVWKLDGTAFIGECVYHQPGNQIVIFSGTTGNTININDINKARGEDELILYTPQYDKNTLTNNNGVEILVEMSRPTLILPPSLSLFPGLPLPFEEGFFLLPETIKNPQVQAVGYVRKILDGQGSTPIPFDHVVLSATGEKRNKLLSNLQVDVEIGISQAINHTSDDNCMTPVVGKDWTKAYASIGGSFYFLEDGIINSFSDKPQATIKDARTAIAYNDDYVFFIVVDQIVFGDDIGDPDPNTVIRSGMNMAQLGYFAREWLGADFGIAQDGGGSTTMVVNGEVVNVPNDKDSDLSIVPCPTQEFPEALYLPIINRSSNALVQIPAGSTPSPTDLPSTPNETCYKGTERFVANGMMMVAVKPMATSMLFTPGQTVHTTLGANLRLGPGTNFAVLDTLPAGSEGIITATAVKNSGENLNGVFATGFHWWNVDFGGGQVGWMSESVLAAGP